MTSLPPDAQPQVRERILNALTSKASYDIYEGQTSASGRRFLRHIGLDPDEFVLQDLVEYLTLGRRLYVLTGPSVKGVKYQCCLKYEDDLIIYVKLTLSNDVVFVQIDVHEHNTGGIPLPER
jgi:hypothetical protein